MANGNNKTFMKISNKDIYDRITAMENAQNTYHAEVKNALGKYNAEIMLTITKLDKKYEVRTAVLNWRVLAAAGVATFAVAVLIAHLFGIGV